VTERGWRVLMVVLLTAVVALAVAVLVAARALRAAEVAQQRSCGVVVALDSAYRSAPPQTPAGREIAAQIADLRRTYDCPA
jgi:hypothetical protein